MTRAFSIRSASMTAYEQRIFWPSFVLRASVGFLAWLITEHTDIALVGDAETYEDLGSQIAEEWYWTGRSAVFASNSLT